MYLLLYFHFLSSVAVIYVLQLQYCSSQYLSESFICLFAFVLLFSVLAFILTLLSCLVMICLLGKTLFLQSPLIFLVHLSWTHDPPASTSEVLELQVHATMPGTPPFLKDSFAIYGILVWQEIFSLGKTWVFFFPYNFVIHFLSVFLF
jgi:hypothetical protein